ncbi:MAG: ion transporter [Phycisphaerae bacterium]|nr:ion transporter [Phycisphaerae bacterium]
MDKTERNSVWSSRRKALFEVIFETDTPAGRTFDICLIVAIVISVLVVMLDSVSTVRTRFGGALNALEWFFTIVFTIEYGLRLWCVGNRRRYAASFFGVVDLLAFAPTWLGLLVPPVRYVLIIRLLRVLRIFRVFKLAQCLGEAQALMRALAAGRQRIFVFLFAVLTLVVIIGATMYLIEGPDNGFTSIPTGVYWAIVTLTTVGYGDISPQTPFGQFLASLVMILGYAIIAVPTGIVTVELARSDKKTPPTSRACRHCGRRAHDADAAFCKYCGGRL